MRINSSTDYAIKILAYLSRCKRMVSAAEIAKEMDIPPKYVTKILGMLKNSGLVKSYQGINGGYILEEMAQDAPLLDVIGIMEGELLAGQCSNCRKGCLLYVEDALCPIRVAYTSMQSAIQESMRNVTLKDLSPSEELANTRRF